MRRTHIVGTLLLLGGVAVGMALGTERALGQAGFTEGRLLAAQCAQCHGTNGSGPGDIERLAGKSFGELYEELLEMKYESTREIMHLQAKGYTDEQLRSIAEYFASLPDGAGSDD